VQNYTGNELINAPKFSFAGYARWRFPLGSGGSVTPRFDWTYKSRVYFSPVNGEGVSQPAFWLLNLRVDYAPPGDKFDVAFWVRNVANKTYSLDVINLAELRGSILYAIGDPRTFGVTVSYRF